MYLNILSTLTFNFGLLSVKTKPIYVYVSLGGALMGVKTIEKPLQGQPKGGHGCLIELAG